MKPAGLLSYIPAFPSIGHFSPVNIEVRLLLLVNDTPSDALRIYYTYPYAHKDIASDAFQILLVSTGYMVDDVVLNMLVSVFLQVQTKESGHSMYDSVHRRSWVSLHKSQRDVLALLPFQSFSTSLSSYIVHFEEYATAWVIQPCDHPYKKVGKGQLIHPFAPIVWWSPTTSGCFRGNHIVNSQNHPCCL